MVPKKREGEETNSEKRVPIRKKQPADSENRFATRDGGSEYGIHGFGTYGLGVLGFGVRLVFLVVLVVLCDCSSCFFSPVSELVILVLDFSIFCSPVPRGLCTPRLEMQ